MVLPPKIAPHAPAPARDLRSAPPGPRVEAPPAPRPVVTQAIVGLNVLVMGAMIVSGVSAFDPDGRTLVAWGSDFGPLTLRGQYWRLLTSTFLHGGLLHLGMNMYVLWGAGRAVERFYGRLGFAEVYLLSAIGGSAASVLWNPNVNSVGASGAVFGVVGAFAAFLLKNRNRIDPEARTKLLRSLGFFVLINLAIGFAVPLIDQAAHVGGLTIGALGGYVVAPLITRDGPSLSRARYAIPPALTVAIVVVVALRGLLLPLP